MYSEKNPKLVTKQRPVSNDKNKKHYHLEVRLEYF